MRVCPQYGKIDEQGKGKKKFACRHINPLGCLYVRW